MRDNVEFDDAHITIRKTDGSVDYEAMQAEQERSPFLARRDNDLNEIETMLRQARDLVDGALTGFGMYATPQHRNVSVELGQLIEQVIEFKRIEMIGFYWETTVSGLTLQEITQNAEAEVHRFFGGDRDFVLSIEPGETITSRNVADVHLLVVYYSATVRVDSGWSTS